MIITNKIGAADFRIGGGAIQKAYLGDTLVWAIGSDIDFGDWDLVAEVKWAKYDGTPNIIMPKYDNRVVHETMFIPDDSSNLTGILKVRSAVGSNGGVDNGLLIYRNIYGYIDTINLLYVNWLKLRPALMFDSTYEYRLTSITFQPEAYINQYCTDLYCMCSACNYVKYVDFRGFDTSNVTSFESCLPPLAEEIDVRGWSTRNTTQELYALTFPYTTKYLWISKEFFDYGGDIYGGLYRINIPNRLFTGTDVQKTQQCCEQFIQAMLGCRNRVDIRISNTPYTPTPQYTFDYIKSISNGRLEAYGWEFNYIGEPFYEYSIALKEVPQEEPQE